MRARPVSFLLLSLAGAAVAGAQEPPSEVLEILARGRAALENFDYDGAAVAYQEAVRLYRGGRLDADDPGVRRGVAAALEGKAAALLGGGQPDGVAGALQEALQVEPSFRPDPMVNSPRLLEIFRRVRSETVGFLSVETIPDGCGVWIDGRHAGRTPLANVPWLAGPAEVRLQMPGFEPETVRVDVVAGAMVAVDQPLVANARTLIFRTSPPGVRIIVDGEERAVTDGPAAAEEARALGFEPSALSREVGLVLSPGTRQVRFELPCHGTWVESIRVEPHAEPLHYKPMVMEKRIGALTLRSLPPGARVRIDSAGGEVFDGLQEVGRTPLTLEEVCAGDRRIELAGEKRGKWSGRVTVEAGGHPELLESLRPTLAFVGVLAREGIDPGPVDAVRERIRAELAALDVYNTVVVHNARGLEPSPGRLLPPVEPEALAALATRLDAELLLLGEVREEDLRPVLDLHLFSRHQATPESVTAPLEEAAPIDRFLARLGHSPSLRRPWIGLLAAAVDGERPLVARVLPGGPAAAAGVQVGDRILSVGEHPVGDAASVREALEALAAERAGRDVSLRILRGDVEMEMPLRLDSTPVLLEPGRPELLYNKLLVDLDYRAGDGDGPGAAAARLSRALAFVHFGRFDLALQEALDGLELPAGPGVSAGTVAYLRGLCYERLGIPDRAREAFLAAAASEGATLGSHDGPAVPPMARFHLEALGP